MSFKYKKNQYENIFRWDESGEGTCFYCKEDKDIKVKLIGDKGICNECLKDFQIGNVGVDRHVIHYIIPEFNNYKDVIKWFEDKGVRMVFKDVIDDTYIYDAVNDEIKYKEFQELLKSGDMFTIDQKTMESSNSIEISEDGKSIHIVY